MDVKDSYISRLGILTFGGEGFLLLGVVLLCLGVSNSYVWDVGILSFWAFTFLRLAVKDSYVWGFRVILRLGDRDSYFWGLGIVPFRS